MKKILGIVCAGMLLLSNAQAKLIWQESFDGLNGTVGTLNAGATKTGSEDNPDYFYGMNYNETRWWSYSGSSNYIQVAEGSLSYAGYQTTGLGNKAYLSSSGADDLRTFSSQAVTSGKVYLSAIINVEELATVTAGDYFLSFCDANPNFFGRLFAKSIKEGESLVGYKLGVAKQNDGDNYLRYTGEVYAPKTDVLVVVEYEFVEGAKNDTVRLYVNPSKTTTAPTLVCVQDTVTGGGMDRGAKTQNDPGIYGLFGVALRQSTQKVGSSNVRSTPKVYVDEIKVATVWADLWAESSGGGEEDKIKKVDNIAALKSNTVYQPAMLLTQPVVIHIVNDDVYIQDESGAVLINDFSELRYLKDVKIGDKLDSLSATIIESVSFINGVATARLSKQTTPKVISSGNTVEAFAVTLDNAEEYGPALVQLSEVSFQTGALKTFDVGLHTIAQGSKTADLNVPNGCDIIGEAIPEKADVRALFVKKDADIRLQIRSSADVTNRKSGGEPTSIENNKAKTKSYKTIRDGQLIIIKDGKEYNILGSQL
jgi:hypothetical protein